MLHQLGNCRGLRINHHLTTETTDTQHSDRQKNSSWDWLTDLLVLLEEFVGELGEKLEEGEVGRRSGRIQRILEGGGRHQDTLPVQAGHRLPVLQRV